MKTTLKLIFLMILLAGQYSFASFNNKKDFPNTFEQDNKTIQRLSLTKQSENRWLNKRNLFVLGGTVYLTFWGNMGYYGVLIGLACYLFPSDK